MYKCITPFRISRNMNPHAHKIIKVFNAVLLIAILTGIISTICKYLTFRPFWIDEAMLMSNVVARDITEITQTPLLYGQNSSLGYLLLLKIITFFLGSGEYALRLLSLLSWGSVLYLLGKISKTHLKASFTTVFVICFIYTASDTHMYYAQEAKSYMFECFWILLVLYAFGLRWKANMSSLSFSLICAISFFFAYPTFFIIVAAHILLFSRLVIQNNNKASFYRLVKKEILILIPLVLISSLLAIFWIIPGSKHATDPDYWKLLTFPLFPQKIDDFHLIKEMIAYHMLAPIQGSKVIIIAIFTIIGASFFYKSEGNYIIATMLLSSSILLITSSVGYWPIISRLLIFNFLFFLLISCFIIESYIRTTHYVTPRSMIVVSCAYILLISVSVSPHDLFQRARIIKHFSMRNYKSRESFYKFFEDFKESSRNHAVYINRAGLPLYDYLQGYQSGVDDLYSPKVIKQNTLYGARILSYDFNRPYSYAGSDKEKIVEETLEWMSNYKRVYLFVSHDSDILPYLRKKGTLKKFNNSEWGYYVYEHS